MWQNHTISIQGIAEYYEGVMKGQLQVNSSVFSQQQIDAHVYNQYDSSDNGISMSTNIQMSVNGIEDYLLKSFILSVKERETMEFEILKAKENNKIIGGKFSSNKGRFSAETSFGNNNITPVSYTHLDVYKRQFLDRRPIF